MLACLIYLIIWIIVALIVLFVLEKILAMFIPDMDARVVMLIRLLVGLLVLLYALDCIGLIPLGWYRRPLA